ncbi:MAG TPA: site-specific integrase [Edaphobacter sp.]|nr:site-specific integrase [Edaphobacter sp.]
MIIVGCDFHPSFQSVSRHGSAWGRGISENVVWYVVRDCARRLGLERLAPHDLRRTCAKLCHVNGGELEQIQFLLGHASVLTTERYLGCKQNLEKPVNDRFGSLFEWKWLETSQALLSPIEQNFEAEHGNISLVVHCFLPVMLPQI